MAPKKPFLTTAECVALSGHPKRTIAFWATAHPELVYDRPNPKMILFDRRKFEEFLSIPRRRSNGGRRARPKPAAQAVGEVGHGTD